MSNTKNDQALQSSDVEISDKESATLHALALLVQESFLDEERLVDEINEEIKKLRTYFIEDELEDILEFVRTLTKAREERGAPRT